MTENLKTIRSIPMTLENAPSRLIVRGEVYMPKKSFEKLNARQEAEGKPLFANPRNAAAGSLRQLDPKIAAQRGLDIYIFNIQLIEGVEFATHEESLSYLENLKFKVIPHKNLKNVSEIVAHVAAIDQDREKLTCDIDGAVIKVNDLNQRARMGSTALPWPMKAPVLSSPERCGSASALMRKIPRHSGFFRRFPKSGAGNPKYFCRISIAIPDTIRYNRLDNRLTIR